jgi:CHAP domain
MKFLGYSPTEEEVKQKRFGTSTVEQAEKLREAIANNPLLAFASFILQFIFGSDIEEATPELRRGTSRPIREYRSSTDPQLQSLEAVSTSQKGAAGAAELASRYLGQRETGDNKGSVVKYFNGAEGEPWCGGFVHKIMAKAISPALYSQGDFLRARSFQDEAARFGAFRKPTQGYTPSVGDVVVFTRGDEKGHVGIVSDVAQNGTVTYISGNDANAVRARTFDTKNPPQSLLGYGDTHALAKAKGIALEAPGFAMKNSTVTLGATRHSDAAVRGG